VRWGGGDKGGGGGGGAPARAARVRAGSAQQGPRRPRRPGPVGAAAQQELLRQASAPTKPQIAGALFYIHRRRILHRDLKTQNVLLAGGGLVMLADFGISKARVLCGV
jgi:Ser/Thr protein kinase RdoA (MazF antagonist)